MNIKNNKIAHRGMFDNIKYPENSIKSFKKAISLNFPIELDIQLTKDNIIIVFHDTNLKRMTNIDKNISDCTYEEIKKLYLLKTKEKIPTLKEVLDLVQNKVLLDIEIKSSKNNKKFCKLIMEELKSYQNYILKSFNPNIVHFLKNNYKNIEVGLIIDEKYFRFFSNKIILYYCKADFLAINKKLLSKPRFQKLKKKYPLLIWTMKKDDDISNNECIYICNDLL